MDDERPFSSGKHKSGAIKKRSRPKSDFGKRKRPNFGGGGDASANTKPVDTLYRILCHAKKIGSVLGKGGSIVNALRDQTHAKIRVADAIPGVDQRVIIIYSYPMEQPSEVGNNEDVEDADEHKDMQPHCPAQDALLKVHDRVVADEYLQDGVFHEKTKLDEEVTARILVQSNQIGCLIGKGGTIIKKLRSDTGADVRIARGEQLPPCAMDTDELVQISGVPAVVKKALYVVSTMLHQHHHKEYPPVEELLYVSAQGSFRFGAPMPLAPQENTRWPHQLPGAHGTPPEPFFGGHRGESFGPLFSGHRGESFGYGTGNGEPAEEFSIRILCPTGRIGGVIGKGGVNVKQLEQQTGAKIQVEDTAPDADERIIIVTSKEAPLDQISSTIDAVLQLQNRTSASSEDGTVTTRLLVPSGKVGCLLGQGGSVITEMRRRTGADIRVSPKNEKPKYTADDEELVQISGNKAVAEEALFEVASRLRTRTLRPGNAPVIPAASGPLHGFAPAEKRPGMNLPSYGMVGAENVGYGYSEITGPRNEAPGYRGPPTADYGAGPRREAPGYPGPPTAEYGAGPRREAPGYPGPGPLTDGYSTGPRREAPGYPGPGPLTDGYSTGPRREAPGYPGPLTDGYSAGPRREAPGYPGPPTDGYNAGYPGPPTDGYSAGPRREAPGYPGPPTATGYGAGQRQEHQGNPIAATPAGYSAGQRQEYHGYSGAATATGYNAAQRQEGQGYPNSAASAYGGGARYEAQGFPSPAATGYNTETRHEAQSYTGPPTGPGYNTQPRYEAQGYPGAQTSSLYNDASRYETWAYPGPQNATGYPNLTGSMEIKIPSSAVASVLGVNGCNISDIRQISGARVKINDPIPGASECVVEIHGSSEQMKAAQSLVQSFVSVGGQNAQAAPRMY